MAMMEPTNKPIEACLFFVSKRARMAVATGANDVRMATLLAFV